MRKPLSWSFAAALCLACLSAGAEETRYSIQQLPSMTTSRWQQTYEAYGRAIQVDVDVSIPQAQAAPVLTVQAAPPLDEPLRSELEAWYAQAEKTDKVNHYSFQSTDYKTTITHALPPTWGETRDSEFVAGAMGIEEKDLYVFEQDTAYAYNNALTVAEALDIAQQHVAQLYPDETLRLRRIYLSGRTYWKKNNATIRDEGGYNLCFSQTFHGIPYLASSHEAFTQFSVGDENHLLSSRGLVRASVFDADAWSVSCCLYRETGVLYDDISLLPFDAVKDKVEALILKGYVRWIDDVSLGYAQFDSDLPDEQILVPCWVVWCEYHPGGPRSERRSDVNSSASLMYDGNNDYYRPLIINAQTGEMLDSENETEGRCACPAILP